MDETPELCYSLIAQEMPEPFFNECEDPVAVLETLDPFYVERAREHAHDKGLPWPPRPEYDGWVVSVSRGAV